MPRAELCGATGYRVADGLDAGYEGGEGSLDPGDGSGPDTIRMHKDLGEHAGDHDPFVSYRGRQSRNGPLVMLVVGAEVSDENAGVED